MDRLYAPMPMTSTLAQSSQFETRSMVYGKRIGQTLSVTKHVLYFILELIFG